MLREKSFAFLSFTLLLPNFCGLQARAQQLPDYRGTATDMLDLVSKDVQKHYYDPKFHGLDWPAVARDTRAKIKTSNSLNLAMAHIAQALASLDDSHTFFLPPPRPYTHDYGFRMQMIGDRCYVSRVRPGSDAEAKGVTPDELVLPTAADLAAGRDPVLARAAALVGAKLTPEQAGKMFPFEWPRE